ncbi:MAG: Fic family protein [Prevotella sp.]
MFLPPKCKFKVPMKLETFCIELNKRRKAIDPSDIASVYELSFWAHFELVTIHPWADGNDCANRTQSRACSSYAEVKPVFDEVNGRTCRLLMNLLQMEYDVLPTKVLKEDKGEYIQALIDTRENEDIEIFLNCMTELHCAHLKHDNEQYKESVEMVDKADLIKEMVDKWSIKPTLAEKMVDILLFMADKEEIKTETVVRAFGYTETTAKRYLRQLAEFGYLEAHGGNRNRSYTKQRDIVLPIKEN